MTILNLQQASTVQQTVRGIHELFEQQAARIPDQPALICGTQTLSYAELNRRANQLAQTLRSYGTGPETLVGVCLERCVHLLPALLAILKAGGAYVPLDPAYPVERLELMLEDCQAPLLLTQGHLRESYPDLQKLWSGDATLIDLDADWAQISQQPALALSSSQQAFNLAYVIYTSGSTGRPKGVAIEHRSVLAFIEWSLAVFTPAELAAVLAGTSICFDLSVFEIFVTLSAGGTVILAENALALPTLPAADQVTLINSVPSAVSELVRLQAIPASVQTVNLAGEPLPLRLVQQLYRLPTVQRVLNLYGPSEDTTYSTIAIIPRESTLAPSIGVPISGTQVYLLDPQFEPVPHGQIGELYLGGEGLARGYLNRPALSAERFVPNPFAPAEQAGARLYRTGDLARYRENGEIEFLGRRDHQVKIRGFRIELGEIEATLYQHPHIHECVVIARGQALGEQRLIAYVVANQQRQLAATEKATTQALTLDPASLRSFLKQRLPDYMLPAVLIVLAALPRTPNGKIDRKRLPEPLQQRPELTQAYLAPRNAIEAELCAIWTQVLDLEPIGVEDRLGDLGGHSLTATRILARIHEQFQVQLSIHELFQLPTIASQAQVIMQRQAGTTAAKQPALVALHDDQPIIPSRSQQSLWFMDQWDPANIAYNVPVLLKIEGRLDQAALERSLQAIVQRHAALRMYVPAIDGQPMLFTEPELPLELPLIDLSELPAPAREAASNQFILEETRKGFALDQAPLIRAHLLRLQPEVHQLLVVVHHIIFDEWSINILFHELQLLYAAERSGQLAVLPALPVQYSDYVQWLLEWLTAPDARGVSLLQRQRNYWQQQLAGMPDALELPTDYPRPPTQSFRGAVHSFLLPTALIDDLTALARQEDATLFMLLLAALQIVLHRYSGQDDIVVGAPLAGRNRSELEPLLGYFINTLILRGDLSGNPRFRSLLARTRDVCLGAYANQDLPFDMVVETVRPIHDPAMAPAVQVMLVLHNIPMQPFALPDLTLTPLPVDNQTAKFDLTLYLDETSAGLRGRFEYATDLFAPSTIERLAGHLQTLLAAIVADPDRPIEYLPILSEAERRQLLLDWNASNADYPREACFQELFEAQVARTPDATAVVYNGQSLSYQELNRRANQVAHALHELGVGPDTLVGLCIERSLEMLVGMVGILKAGAAYVPLDPGYPAERLQFMLQDAGVPVVLAQQAISDQRFSFGERRHAEQIQLAAHTTVINLDTQWPMLATRPDSNPPRRVLGDQRAYVIYTSGSTGRPKGVMVRQRGLLNLCYGLRRFFDDPQVQRTGLITSISFDISVNQIFPTLLFGRALHIVPEETKLESQALMQFLVQQQIELLDAVPSYMQAVLKDIAPQRVPTALRYLLIGGEKLETALLAAIFEQLGQSIEVVNIYGLTEITDINAFSRLRAQDLQRVVTVGMPLQNNRIYITNRLSELQPIGVAGEVCVAGESLARGYLNRPALTAEKYVVCPFEDGQLMCRTGDLGRRLADGTIVILGRLDHQVKIRGFRIELGEIEATLLLHPLVREGVVVARRDNSGDAQLVAYVVMNQAPASAGTGSSPAVEDLRRFLREKLPAYMLPALFMTLEALPRTPNGKIDRRALPVPTFSPKTSEFVAPQTALEQVIAEMWRETLQLARIGIHDNFFELGGHSLNATRVVSRIRQTFQVNLTVRQMFAAPSIAGLASLLLKHEQPAGRSEKIARALQRLRGMSVEDRQRVLQQKKGSEGS